jgi:O-antigen ligase
MLELLLPFQRLFKPGLILLLLWSSYRTVFKRDRAVGLVLYLGLIIIVDSFYNTGIYIPGLEYGSIRYSEVCAFFLILNNPSVKQSVRSNRLILFLLILYFLLFFYSGLRGYTFEDGINNFRRYIIPQITAFLVSYRGFNKKEDYERFLFHFMTLLIIIGLFTFWDLFFDRWILHSDTLRSMTYLSGRKHGRFGSFFLNPNYLGAFAVLVFPVVFIRALLEKENLKRIYCWIGVLALAFALVETQSRGPLLGFVVSLFFFVFIPTKGFSMFKKIAFICAFLFVFYLFLPGFFEHATERFSMIESEMAEDTKSRNTVWSYTFDIIRDYPIFGIGLGETQYFKYMIAYGFIEEFLSRPLDNPHNSYLQIAVQAGIPSLFIFVFLNFLLIKKGIYTLFKSKKSEMGLILTGFVSGMCGFLIANVAGSFMFVESNAPAFLVVFGLVFSIINLIGSNKNYENINSDFVYHR